MDLDNTEDKPQIPSAMPETDPRATVLVPLYNYPLTDKTWQPLYEAYVRPYSPLLGFQLENDEIGLFDLTVIV
jgi:hypothetical protein